MAKSLSVTLSNRVDEIPRLHQLMEEFGTDHGLPPGVVNAANVSLDEVLTNIISYGYAEDDGGEHAIEVRVSLDTVRLTLEVEDDSRPFDPLAASDPDVASSLDDRSVGGLGIFLVKQMMDRVEYRRVSDRNLLIMEKQITSADRDQDHEES